MYKIINNALRACFVILVMTGNSVLAQSLEWGLVSDLSITLQHAYEPQIALSSDGKKATAVWRRSNGSNDIIQSASATISGNIATWGSVKNLSAIGQSASQPQIALSSDGTKAIAVWRRSNGSNTIIQSASATISGNAATWSSVTDLSAIGEHAYEPQIALSSDGTKVTAVWRRTDGSKIIIQSASATISGNTATWSSVTDLSAAGQKASGPQITLSSDGTKATAVWLRFDGEDYITQSKSATISGNIAAWSSVTDLSAIGKNAYTPQIGLSSDGTKATAVWRAYDGSDYIIQSASATISGNTATWGSVTDLSAIGQLTSVVQMGLSSDGTKATAVWESYDGSRTIIQSASATISGNIATWSSVTDLSAIGKNAYTPQIGLSSDGTKATAIWRHEDGSNDIVQSASATISENTATWGSVTDLSVTGKNSYEPQIGLSSDGKQATAVWRGFRGSNIIILSKSAVIAPSLTILKDVINNHGGTTTSTAFTLYLTGGVYGGTEAMASGDTPTVISDVVYALSEDGLPGYQQVGDVACTDDIDGAVVLHPVTLSSGQNVTCTITNDDIAPTLTLTKDPTNDNGGSALPDAFLLKAGALSATSGTPISGVKSNTPYTLSETLVDGYTFVNVICTSDIDGSSNEDTFTSMPTINLAEGEDVSCTITNDDTPRITIVKEVTNDNGGNAHPSNFTLRVIGGAYNGSIERTSGDDIVVSDNIAYTLSEDPFNGYTQTGVACKDYNTTLPIPHPVVLAKGQSAICTLSNDDSPPYLTIVKEVVNDDGGNASAEEFVLRVTGKDYDGSVPRSSGDELKVDANTTYTLSEDKHPGYLQMGITCTDNDTTVSLLHPILLTEGQSATCTIQNNDIAPELTIIKEVINENNGEAIPSDFILRLSGGIFDGSLPRASEDLITVNANTIYTLSEDQLPGYSLMGIECKDIDTEIILPHPVTLAEGQSVRCTISNLDYVTTFYVIPLPGGGIAVFDL